MDRFPLVLGIIWLAVVSPGADFAMVSRSSCIDGRRAGLMAAAGIAIACWVHVLYAIFGLALAERLFPQFLDVIRIAGAAYLVWLGLGMMFARPVPVARDAPPPRRGHSRALVAGLLTNALNPKTAIFVVSLYAQAIGPATSRMVQFGYGLAISLSHLIWFAAVALFLSRPAIRAHVLARQRTANRIIGAFLLTLGLALALTGLPRS